MSTSELFAIHLFVNNLASNFKIICNNFHMEIFNIMCCMNNRQRLFGHQNLSWVSDVETHVFSVHALIACVICITVHTFHTDTRACFVLSIISISLCWPCFLNCKHCSQHAIFIQLVFLTIHFACGYFFSSLKLVPNAEYSWMIKTEGLYYEILGILDLSVISVPSLIWWNNICLSYHMNQWFIWHPQNTHQEHLRCSKHIMKTFCD